MLNKQRYYEIIDYVLEKAHGYDTRVLINGQAEGLTRYANSIIHQNVYEDLTTITITIIEGEKRSEQTTTDYSDQGLALAVQEAIKNLEYLPASGPQPAAVTEPAKIEADNYNKDLAKACGVKQRALALKEALNDLPETHLAYGTYTHTEMQLAYGNSSGVKRFVRGNHVQMTVLIADEHGGTGFAAVSAQKPEDINVNATFKHVLGRAKLNTNAQQIEPGAYTVILEPAAVGNIITYLSYIGFSARSVQNRISFLSGKLGEKVFDERITITDDWQNPNTLPLPFDMEGYARQKVTIIENGVAKDLIYDTMSAMQDGIMTSGHSLNMPAQGGLPLNIVMAGGEKPLEQLIAETEDGILISRFHYMNVVNPRSAQLTGLTRDGVFQIKNGKIVNAVKNMRFTESMLEAFNNVLEIASNQSRVPSFFGNFFIPAIKIDNFHFTGKTE